MVPLRSQDAVADQVSAFNVVVMQAARLRFADVPPNASAGGASPRAWRLGLCYAAPVCRRVNKPQCDGGVTLHPAPALGACVAVPVCRRVNKPQSVPAG